MQLKDCENGFYTDGKKVYEKYGVDVIEWLHSYDNLWETDACVENIESYDIDVTPFKFKEVWNGYAFE